MKNASSNGSRNASENIGGEVYFKQSGLSPAYKFTMKRPQEGNSFHGFLMFTESKNQNEKDKCMSEPSKIILRTLNTRYTLYYKIIQQRRPLKEPHCIYDELNTKHITPKLEYASRFSHYQMT